MTCEEVKISLHDYIDEQLNNQTKRDIAFHLRTCDVCLVEYKRLTKFFLYIKELPHSIEPPPDIMENVRSELLSRSSVIEETGNRKSKEKKKNKRDKNKDSADVKSIVKAADKWKLSKYNYPAILFTASGREIRKIILTLFPLFFIGAAFLVYDFGKYNSPWQVKNLNGTIHIDGAPIQNEIWNQGETLATEDNANATVLVPKVGAINVGPNSVILLERAKDGANKIKINRGSVSVINSNDMPDFVVEVEGAEIIDRGGQFDISTNEYNQTIVSVKYAFVEIEYNGETFYLDRNYSCQLKKGAKPGLPYHNNASDSLKTAIEQFNSGSEEDSVIEVIISLSKEHDLLTLLALIPNVKPLQRQIIFQEISNHFPPPESVTRAGILRLDEEMLYRWWVEIEWQI